MAIFGLFNLLALIYLFRGAQIVWRIGREWQILKQDPLSNDKQNLADQAAFFVAVPPAVALHEFFHALATWLVGGRIVDFGYGFFWGYVVPVGEFTPAENWLIAIAGTWGNILFGAAVYLLLRQHPARTFRYFGLRAFRFQLYFALVYYPILTLLIPAISDWRIIYNFAATPVLSGVTAVVHLIAFYFFYMADRRGRFETPAFETTAAQTHFSELEQQLALNPSDKTVGLGYTLALQRGGARQRALIHLKKLLQAHPDAADIYAQLAVLEAGKGHIAAASKEYAEKALALGTANARSRALSHHILAEYALARNRYQEAANRFSQAIEALLEKENATQTVVEGQAQLAQLFHRRSVAYRRQNLFDLAYEDGQKAVELAQARGEDEHAQFYRDEMAIIEHHAGRPLGNSSNPPPRQDVV